LELQTGIFALLYFILQNPFLTLFLQRNVIFNHFLFADDVRWQIVAKTKNGPARDYSVSYQNLLPSTAYKFRVIAYNKYGVSYPAYTKDSVSSLLSSLLFFSTYLRLLF